MQKKKMLKKISVFMLAVATVLGLAACGNSHMSSFKSIGAVTTNTKGHVHYSFYELEGKVVFKLSRDKFGDSDIVYTGKLDEGTVHVYYDYANTQNELFTINGGETVESSDGYLDSKYVYITIETEGKCKNGEFDFTTR